MSRTKGAKDKQPRRLHPASLANMPTATPGHASFSLRVYGPINDMRWFEGMRPPERGAVITRARKEQQ